MDKPRRSSAPLGELRYDSRDPLDIVNDYVIMRGDIDEPYARHQLADVIYRKMAIAWQEGYDNVGVGQVNPYVHPTTPVTPVDRVQQRVSHWVDGAPGDLNVNIAVSDILEILEELKELKKLQPINRADAPHSRACASIAHDHGYGCHRSCPTCGGRPNDAAAYA